MTPTLTEREIAAIGDSFARIAADPEGAGAAFYAHLFRIAPETRALFPADISRQAGKLTAVTGVVVAQLHDLGPLRGVLADLGRRHAGLGVAPGLYAAVGAALRAMLAERLGPAATPATLDAWGRAYGMLAAAMIDASAAAAAANAPHPEPLVATT